jgi:hypothetical protein
VSTLLALASVLAFEPNSGRQLWSELDIAAHVSPRVDLTWALLKRENIRGAEANPSALAAGIDTAVRLSRHFTLTPSYYYAQFKTPTGRWADSHLPTLAATLVLNAERCVVSGYPRQPNPCEDRRDVGKARTTARIFEEQAGRSMMDWTDNPNSNRQISGIYSVASRPRPVRSTLRSYARYSAHCGWPADPVWRTAAGAPPDSTAPRSSGLS